jgi:hypothetical protein
VLVPVPFVRGVKMAVVQVVEVVSVRNRCMPAAGSVLMRMLAVFHALIHVAFVPMVAVLVVTVAVVHVVDVIVVLNGHMPTAGPVHMGVFMIGRMIVCRVPVGFGRFHRSSLAQRSRTA